MDPYSNYTLDFIQLAKNLNNTQNFNIITSPQKNIQGKGKIGNQNQAFTMRGIRNNEREQPITESSSKLRKIISLGKHNFKNLENQQVIELGQRKIKSRNITPLEYFNQVKNRNHTIEANNDKIESHTSSVFSNYIEVETAQQLLEEQQRLKARYDNAKKYRKEKFTLDLDIDPNVVILNPIFTSLKQKTQEDPNKCNQSRNASTNMSTINSNNNYRGEDKYALTKRFEGSYYSKAFSPSSQYLKKIQGKLSNRQLSTTLNNQHSIINSKVRLKYNRVGLSYKIEDGLPQKLQQREAFTKERYES
ncbi:UNKNOWN [Stylonychia lemnae]|uniref:Uncharacterized protein n=1 Tax=Stylonychia lemnae TaxID=5949 RepID=A0A078B4J2_STYLE|nr:UNKNOWN [Stylonychia lemnae]|eukprot:CDW89191.1 UNKNOWN [Stylonychia lemnae]